MASQDKINMDLINKGGYLDKGLMLETSTIHKISQAKSIPYQGSLVNHTHIQLTRQCRNNSFFSKTSLQDKISLKCCQDGKIEMGLDSPTKHRVPAGS